MLPLPSAPLGVPLQVTELNALDQATQRQLAGLGVLAGAEIVLMQRFPICQVKVGLTQVQLAPHAVSAVFVRPISAP